MYVCTHVHVHTFGGVRFMMILMKHTAKLIIDVVEHILLRYHKM